MWKVVITANVEIENWSALKKHYKRKTENAFLDMEISDGLKKYRVSLDDDFIGYIVNEGEQISYWMIGSKEAYCAPVYVMHDGLPRLAIEITLVMKEAKIVADVKRKRA